jgi:hypothetical protein
MQPVGASGNDQFLEPGLRKLAQVTTVRVQQVERPLTGAVIMSVNISLKKIRPAVARHELAVDNERGHTFQAR